MITLIWFIKKSGILSEENIFNLIKDWIQKPFLPQGPHRNKQWYEFGPQAYFTPHPILTKYWRKGQVLVPVRSTVGIGGGMLHIWVLPSLMRISFDNLHSRINSGVVFFPPWVYQVQTEHQFLLIFLKIPFPAQSHRQC